MLDKKLIQRELKGFGTKRKNVPEQSQQKSSDESPFPLFYVRLKCCHENAVVDWFLEVERGRQPQEKMVGNKPVAEIPVLVLSLCGNRGKIAVVRLDDHASILGEGWATIVASLNHQNRSVKVGREGK